MTATAHGSGGSFDLVLELDRTELMPGTLVDGRARIVSSGGGSIRGARVTLVGVETWRYDETTTDSDGRTHTQTHTAHGDLPHVPVEILGATTFAPGEPRELPFQLPVPSLGPATFEGTEVRVDWAVHLNLDVPGFDPSVELPVVVLQPTALLRAGVIDLGQYALYPEADVEADGLRGKVWLDPAPLVVGSPFRGRLTLEQGQPRRVQEVRLELRVNAKATVGGGREETIILWVAKLAGEGDFGGGTQTFEFDGTVPARRLPTTRTEHGRADAAFHVVIATAWAPDPHLARDVAICSTAEL